MNLQPVEAKTLSTSAPALSAGDLASLVERLYAIDGEASQLAAERDQNSLIQARTGERYVLKVSNASEPVSVVDFQIAALDHVALRAPDRPLPRVLRTRSGRARDEAVLPDGTRCTVRMLTYLDGIQVRMTGRSTAQRRAMATSLAKLDIALADFAHPAAAHDLLWNVATAHRLRDKLDQVADPPRRAILSLFMNRFVENVLPLLASLRAQVIHNDYHLYNVLVDVDDFERVTGVIDFGDMVHAPLVAEIATAAAYHMAGEDDPFAAPAEFVAGYHAALPLEAVEQEVVADLMATRHLITILISEWRAARYVENRDYIMRHNPAAWQALMHMADLSRADSRDRLLALLSTGDPQ
jgi:Ser/Thr protein kinase RdoA (MazF antagonist)